MHTIKRLYTTLSNKLASKRGFTLVELVAALGLAALIMATSIWVVLFVTRLNSQAGDMSQAQGLAQTKTEAIKAELKYASFVHIYSTIPGEFQQEYEYLFVKDGKLQRVSTGAGQPLTSDRGFEEFSYTLDFTPSNAQTLTFQLAVWKKGDKLFDTSETMYIHNLSPGSITGAAEGACVAYKKPGKPVSSIMVTSPSDSITVNGQTMQMEATVLPPNATNKGVAWSVDKPEVASISQNGLLTPLQNGKVAVTATALDGSGVYGSKTIVISNQTVVAKGLTLVSSTGKNTLRRYGHQLAIIPLFTPADTTNKTLVWSVSDTKYATVDQNGVLTSKNHKNKSVIVTAKTTDGSNIQATIEIQLTD